MQEFLDNGLWSLQKIKVLVVYSIAFIIILLLLFFKEIHKIRIPSFLGFLSVLICGLILTGQCYFYIKNYWENIYDEKNEDTWMNLYNIGSGFDENFYFFRTITTLFFAYNYHLGLIPVCSSLKKDSYRSKNKVLKRSICSYTLIFFTFATIGYFTAPVKTPDLIILRYKLFSSDWLINIGRGLIVLSILMKLPINFSAFKISVYSLFDSQPENNKI